MRRILYVATSDIHIATFHIPFIEWLANNGCEVHLAVENRAGYKIPFITKQFNLKFPRSPLRIIYFRTYYNLKKIIDSNNYDLIHCHTPIPSLITRIAARNARKCGTKVLYTAHGFHFYKGGPLLSNITFYLIELFLSRLTDCIITMNHEDYKYTKSKNFHVKSFMIPGIGVDPGKFKPISNECKKEIRKKLGYSEKDLIILYVAEFTKRKNHELVIKALARINSKIPDLKVLFAGKGPLINNIKILARKEGLTNKIEFLGFRDDIPALTAISDIGISTSMQEGLPIGVLQDMFCGLPIVASIERGHKELVVHEENGFLFPQNDSKKFVDYLVKLVQNPDLRESMGQRSLELAKPFAINNSVHAMAEIYTIFCP